MAEAKHDVSGRGSKGNPRQESLLFPWGRFPRKEEIRVMTKNRLEAFSDGVIAILITIMVLELHVPREATWSALSERLPVLLSYVLSYVFLGIYWNNHHH